MDVVTVENLTDDDYEETLATADRAVVDFYAAWCGQCVIFSRRFVGLAPHYPHVRFFVCTSDACPSLRESVDIEEVPYFGLYENGVFVGGFTTTDETQFREQLEARFGASPPPEMLC